MKSKKPIGLIDGSESESELTTSPSDLDSSECDKIEGNVISTSDPDHLTDDLHRRAAHSETGLSPLSLDGRMEGLKHSDALRVAGASLADLRLKHGDVMELAGTNLECLKFKRRDALRVADSDMLDVKLKHSDALRMAGASLVDLKLKHGDVMELAGANLASLHQKHSDAMRVASESLADQKLEHQNETLRLAAASLANLKHKNELNDEIMKLAAAGLSDEYWKMISRIKIHTSISAQNMDYIKKTSSILKDIKVIDSVKNAVASFNVAPTGSLYRHLKHLSLNNDVEALASDWCNTGRDLREAIELTTSTEKDTGDD
ncbi:hypothetical protein ACTG13_09095 [Aeromonas hydrophila]|uniref:hypothetical protein n=1 Tax=Aeromonas hydrophila TaxID=644 RepID=UPI003F7ADD62